ncbi:hypothetical protein VNI00_008002 [Paramarasmius palmivorus]|uniref:Uncharacterized protein n=1 Tax=Paramarasmius palmivorus TaxID=297713 RepID=A0AAW0CY40_9AGAR
MAKLKAANISESRLVLAMAQNAYHAAAQKADSIARSVNALERKEADYKALRRRNKEWHHEYNVVVAQLVAESSALEREQENVRRCLEALDKAEKVAVAAEQLAEPNASIDPKNVDVGQVSASSTSAVNASSELSELSNDGGGKEGARGSKPSRGTKKAPSKSVKKGNQKAARAGRGRNTGHTTTSTSEAPTTPEAPTTEAPAHPDKIDVQDATETVTPTHDDLSIANTNRITTALAKDAAARLTGPGSNEAPTDGGKVDAQEHMETVTATPGDISIVNTNPITTAIPGDTATSLADPGCMDALEPVNTVDSAVKTQDLNCNSAVINQAAQGARTEHIHCTTAPVSDASAVDDIPIIEGLDGDRGGASLSTGVEGNGGSEDTCPTGGETVEDTPPISVPKPVVPSPTPSNFTTSIVPMAPDVHDNLSNDMNGATPSLHSGILAEPEINGNQSMSEDISFRQRMNDALRNTIQSILDSSPSTNLRQYRPPINVGTSGKNAPPPPSDIDDPFPTPDSRQFAMETDGNVFDSIAKPIDKEQLSVQSAPSTRTSTQAVEVLQVIPGLRELQEKLSRIPLGPEGPGSVECPLKLFTVPPIAHDLPGVSADELFERVINDLFHQVFMGRSSEELARAISSGRQGVAGFCDFVTYFSAVGVHCSVFEPRILKLSEAVDIAFPVEHAGEICKQHDDISPGSESSKSSKGIACETALSNAEKGAEEREKDQAALSPGLDGNNYQVKHERPPSMNLLSEVDTEGTFFKRLADSMASAEVRVSRSKVKKVETKKDRQKRLAAAAAERKARAEMKALSAQKKRKTGTNGKVSVSVKSKSARAGAGEASAEKHSGKRTHEEITNRDDDEYFPEADEEKEEDYEDDEHLHQSYKQGEKETPEQHFSRMTDLATTAIENFLENPRDPRKQQIPFGIRNWIRDDSKNCPIAGTTCVELSIHILTTKYGLIKCDYHHWSDKSTLKNDYTAELKPKAERIGMFGQLVTGVPKKPILLKRDTGKSPELGYCHCGCRVKDAVGGLYIYKTQRIYSETHQLDEGFNDIHMDPRNRNILLRALEEESGLKMYERFSHVLSTEGLLRYVEIKDEEREALKKERLVGKRS